MSDGLSAPECPKCGSGKLIVERRMNGDAICDECKWTGPYAECFKKAFNEIEERERKIFEFHGMGPLDCQAAAFAFKAFLEADTRRGGPKSFWHSPLGRKAFMLGWKYGGSK